MKKPQRDRVNRTLRAKAPVAATFEDCVQAFQQLFDSIKVNGSNTELYQMAQSGVLRFRLWGEDCGASSRALDHALRLSPTIKKQTLLLLDDLLKVMHLGYNIFSEAIAEALPGTEFLDDPSVIESINKKSTFEAIPEEEEDEKSTKSCLEEADQIIEYLINLLPALRDPAQEDHRSKFIYQDDEAYYENAYRELARRMFPTAKEELVRRLGYGNWRRRQIIHHPSEKHSNSGSKGHRRRLLRDRVAPWDRRRRGGGLHEAKSEQPLSTQAVSDAGTSTMVSGSETVMTKNHPRVYQDSITSPTDTSQHSSFLQQFSMPQPPEDLTQAEQFNCPYCRCALPLVFSTKEMGKQEWELHVYHDLKPYMCTYENCFHEQQLYSNREEWFQHELNFHRSQLEWLCGICRLTFREKDELQKHLQHIHPELSEAQLELIQHGCKRYSKGTSQAKSCNLCQERLSSMDELESHLSTHLQTFALASLMPEELVDEEESEPEGMMDEYLADIQEFHRRTDPLDQYPEMHGQQQMADATIKAGSIDADNTQITDDDGPDDPSFLIPGNGDRRMALGEWENKVETFLSKQTPGMETLTPVPYNVPERYENFVGRDDDLQGIHNHLSEPGQICTLSGRGGVGKTATAIEYLHKYVSKFSYVFWVEAEDPGLCTERYGKILDSLDVEDKPPLADEGARTYLVREKLAISERRWLLIFDNATTWKDVARFIPRNLQRTTGSVLVTTRSAQLDSSHPLSSQNHPVELKAWTLEHSREFLLTSIDPKLQRNNLQEHDEYHLAEQVVDKVGRLPLAVSMIVGYLKVSRCTLADFLEMWEEKEYIDKKKRKRRKIDLDEDDIDATIDSLWTIGIREVRMNSRRLLDIVSFFDAGNIPRSLLVDDHHEEYLDFLNSSESLSYKRMINELNGRRLLVTANPGSAGEPIYRIHRLLQKKILLDMEDYAFADAFRKAFRLIRKRFPEANYQQVPDPSGWDVCKEYIPHVSTLCRIYKQGTSVSSLVDLKAEDLARLFYDAGFYVWARGYSAYDAFLFFGTAEDILDDIEYDPDGKLRADILCLTGLLLMLSGCYERVNASNRLKRAFDIRKDIYVKDKEHDNDVLLQNAANDYALALLDGHKFEEAGDKFQACRTHYLSWGLESDNPFENAKYFGNYSTILMWRGEIDEAIEYQQKSLAMTERFFREKNSLYYRRLFMLGCLRLAGGDVREALNIHLEVLTKRLELYGKHHEHTILSTYAVGAMYHHLGDPDSAIGYVEQCIECVRNSKWDEAAYARAKYHLSVLYREKGIQEDLAALLEADVDKVLAHLGSFAAECLRGVDDKLMILDDLQPTLLGRYTGRKLLPHLQKCLGNQPESN